MYKLVSCGAGQSRAMTTRRVIECNVQIAVEVGGKGKSACNRALRLMPRKRAFSRQGQTTEEDPSPLVVLCSLTGAGFTISGGILRSLSVALLQLRGLFHCLYCPLLSRPQVASIQPSNHHNNRPRIAKTTYSTTLISIDTLLSSTPLTAHHPN